MATELDIAREYEDISSIHKKHGLAFIVNLFIQRGDKILDLGCGTGYLSKVMAKIVGPEGSVEALDMDRERLQVASSLHGASNLKFINSLCEDSFPGCGYDLVFSNNVFQNIQRIDEVFQNAYKSLSEDRTFAFLVPAPHDLKATYFTPATMVSEEFQSNYMSSFHFRDAPELKQLAIKNHFEVLSFVKEEMQMTFDNIDGLIQYLRVGGYTGKWFDDTHFNKTKMRNHFGDGSIVINYPIFKAVLIKRNNK